MIMTDKTRYMPSLKSIILSAFCMALLIPSGLFAQEKSEEVTIIAPYNPTVTTAQKINRNPKIVPGEDEQLPEPEYSIRSERVSTSIAPEAPNPSRVPGEPAKDLYRSHLRAGFGNYTTPYFELWVNSLQSDEFNAGAHLKHISSFGDIKDYAKSSFSNSLLEAYGSKYFNQNTFVAALGYEHNMLHRYGFKPDDFPGLTIDDDDLSQVYQKIGFKLGLESNKAARDAFNYHVLLDGYYYFDKFESNETRITFSPGIAKKMDLFGNRRSQELGLDLRMDYFLNNDSLSDYSGGIISAEPFLDMDLSPYRVKIGLQGDYRMDSASQFHLYPVIEAEASLLEKMIIVYAGAKGGLERISFEGLSSENPFVNSILPLDYMNNKIIMYGGVKGRITEIVDFNVGLRYSITENMPLFVNDTSTALLNTFGLVYDDVNVFTFNGMLGFRSKSDFGLLLKVAFNAYSADQEEKAWHRPALDASLESYYILKEKLKISADMHFRSGMYARTFKNNVVEPELLDAWFDLGLGAEYRITRQFSAFVKLNNILNQQYYRWYNYPVQQFNALAGIGFSF